MTIFSYLTRLSEAGPDAILTGAAAARYRGPVFERLLRQRVLIEQAPIREWDSCDRCECGLASRPVRQRGNDYVAACPLDAKADAVLTASDLQWFRIDRTELAAAIGTLAGFCSRPSDLTAGVWLLGELPSGRVVVLAFEYFRLAADGIVRIIRSAAPGRPVTLLMPELPRALRRQYEDGGIHPVETRIALQAAGGFDASLLVPPAEDAELVLNVATSEVAWRGGAVVLSRQLFPVFLGLAEKLQAGNPIVSAAQFEIATGRDGRDLIRELRDAFVRSGLSKNDARELIVTVTGRGYRLGVEADMISIRRSP